MDRWPSLMVHKVAARLLVFVQQCEQQAQVPRDQLLEALTVTLASMVVAVGRTHGDHGIEVLMVKTCEQLARDILRLQRVTEGAWPHVETK